ncbi:uncharacterized protein LOC8267879 [Ricinus communis]|uniref:Uncharacterized protein n=1 Tax=Ricinus communis TaxID=3988 RepID=B9R8J9_RICCO|nr:uncharacterized protein LOC8267879 [Ricinus communis]EEF52829.1 conserved hypothetical protein [Ricinus communis]|eukprot:XP_002510642.1 uncharacterized protein LOC8267879 [Ricinus communis]
MSLPDFNALTELHNSANNLLHSPEIQRVLVHQKQEKWVQEVCDASLRMLDVCGISKDVLLLAKEHLIDLQFTLRRKFLSQPNINAKIAAYNYYRKKLKKETLKCLRSLKGMKRKSVVISDISTTDHKLVVVVEVLREVRVVTVSIVESLLSLISIPWLDQRSTRGSFRSKFFSSTSNQSLYDFCDETALQSANKRLEAVEIAIEDLEVELECICRRLIQTRVSLLNILTN